MASLRFNLLGFPVEIQPGFWLLTIFLGLGSMRNVTEMAIWVSVVLVSIMVHELGHATLARAYGQEPRITLHMMGGLTSWSANREMGRLRQILVTLAGPFAGFALGVVALGGAVLHMTAQAGAHGEKLGGFFATAARVWSGHATTTLGFALELLVWANVVWSGINLLPVLPFDGGQILAAALGQKRRLLAATISLVFGLVLAALFWKIGYMYAALIFALGAGTSYMAARRPRHAPASPAMLAQVLGGARAALGQGEYVQARAMAKAVADASPDPEIKRQALDVAGWAAVMANDASAARDILRDVRPPERLDPFLEGAIHHVDGDLDRSVATLTAAREAGDQRPELAGLLVRTLLESRRFAQAAALAIELIDAVDEAEIRRVAHEALDGGASEAAGRLFERLFEHTDAAEDAFDAARAYARADRRDEAFVLLGRAVDKGEEPERARLDADLGRLKDDARFEPALAGASRPAP
jgi:Zn-dependent protease